MKEGDKVVVTLNKEHHWLAPHGNQLDFVEDRTFEGEICVYEKGDSWCGVSAKCQDGQYTYVHVDSAEGDTVTVMNIV